MSTFDLLQPSSFIVPNWSAAKNITAFTTTRLGGLSHEPYASLNLGQHVGDDPLLVANNRQRLPNWQNFFWLKQTHSTICLAVDEIDNNLSGTLEGDACFSTKAKQVCAVMTADCLPILLCDKAGTTVAAVHAGWRGLADGVIENTILKMKLPTGNLMAWMGPAISQTFFEVGEDVKQIFSQYPQAFKTNQLSSEKKYYADLYFIAKQKLLALGVQDISGGNYCTYEQETHFFSHRRACHQQDPINTPATTGRMVSAIYFE
ncbi:peptidoglycan editing factor PgeF [Paraglaciecola sp. L3A3]|uniref:peptidoglycan editing factor PgeF n=1 Tax=Paraglaciecola sp. L3A3 TaxID=2686358 RepID=UPI00131DA235|nr:peptidoglycan editing factor PgeF [Paraglaciecola sp. L3A3]